MAQEIINVGTLPNDGEGDPLRVAFQKINNNFTQLYSSGFLNYEATTFDDAPNQIIFETPANLFTQATFQINSSVVDTNNSQNITINASIRNDLELVKWTGHSTIFINTPVTRYDMVYDSVSGNVRLLVSPLIDDTINHFISAQVQVANFALGMPLSTELGDTLITENNFILTTEN